ncbi:energy transducer TonB [Flavobacterium qiangtangense]|uniref:Energy transducer TonB n=1 Tax=Flavobacterium qiangtangense TaxID=1442595 RepID=A0ABW1PM78_9FLAO
MSNLNVFNQSWNEIVFEGRNKEYGAFQLRQENPKTTLKALFYGTLVVASLVSIPLISSLLKGEVAGVISEPNELPHVVPVTFEKFPEVKPEEKAAEAQPEKSSAKETKFVNTTITDKPTTTTELPVLDLDKPIKTGAVDNAGDNQGAVSLGQGTLDGTGKKPVDEIIGNGGGSGEGEIVGNFGLESSPEFPGGLKKFTETFVSNFKTPDLSEAMTMKIFVSFVVETDGSLSNIKVARDPGYGLGNEAIRALKAIKTKWKAGVQNGKKVRVSYNLPISVVLKN